MGDRKVYWRQLMCVCVALFCVNVMAAQSPSATQPVGALNPHPAGNQRIEQPRGSTLYVSSLNRVLYVDPASSVDLISQVNALFASCNQNCEVHIPAGDYSVRSGTIRLMSSRVSLTGDGRDKVRITYSGTNFLDWRLTSSSYDFNAAGEVSGFTVNCVDKSVRCISAGSVIGPTFRDLNVYGPAGIANNAPAEVGESQGFVFQNTFNWMERWQIRNVNIGGFAVQFHFMKPSGGTDSFGYGFVDGVWSSQSLGTRGIVVDAGASVYNTLGLRFQFNLQGSGHGALPVIFDIAGSLSGVGLEVTGENAGQHYTLAHIGCGGHMVFAGSIGAFGLPAVAADCKAGAGEQYPPYFVAPDVGMGSEASSVGVPPLTHYRGPKDNDVYDVHPTMVSRPGGNGAAVQGVLTRQSDGRNTLYNGFDGGLPYCLSAHNAFSTPSDLHPVWCTDGGGNTSQGGAVAASGFSVNGRSGWTGTKKIGSCTLTIVSGLITEVSGC
jgi:hypothetical protein